MMKYNPLLGQFFSCCFLFYQLGFQHVIFYFFYIIWHHSITLRLIDTYQKLTVSSILRNLSSVFVKLQYFENMIILCKRKRLKSLLNHYFILAIHIRQPEQRIYLFNPPFRKRDTERLRKICLDAILKGAQVLVSSHTVPSLLWKVNFQWNCPFKVTQLD